MIGSLCIALILRPPIRLRSVLSLIHPRYEIDVQDTRNNEGPLEREPTGKTRVLIVVRSQTSFRSCSMAISREISFEKEFRVVKDQIFKSLSTPLIIRVDFLRFPPPTPTLPVRDRAEIHGHF